MRRSLLAAFVTVCSGLLVIVGFSMAQEEKKEGSPLYQLMEKVSKGNATITRNLRRESSYTRAREEVVKAAGELVKLSKDSKTFGKEVAEKHKKDVAEWDKLSDGFIASADKLNKLVADQATAFDAIKASHKEFSKTCTDCHEVFQIAESEF